MSQPRGCATSLPEPYFHWDAPRDTRYMREVDGLDGLLHIFQQDWVGIRAAAGSWPGRKLALQSEKRLPRGELTKLVHAISNANPTRIIVQGMSDCMAQLVDELAAQGLQDRLFVVFHGIPPQWCDEPEIRYAYKCLELANTGKIRRLHVMQAGFAFPCTRLFQPMLFNLSPCLTNEALAAPASADVIGALVPGWVGWRKNIHTNALGAALCCGIDEVWAFGRNLTLPPPLSAKLKIVPFDGRERALALMRASSVVMNVSLVDCHPMVNIEAQTVGTPCVRGALFLDALEHHPYVHLTEVRDMSSAAAIRRAVERVLEVPAAERRELTCDYQQMSDQVAIQRYREFLEI
ncbi:MAG: glycosyltransferase [Janthinobacterium lividum]